MLQVLNKAACHTLKLIFGYTNWRMRLRYISLRLKPGAIRTKPAYAGLNLAHLYKEMVLVVGAVLPHPSKPALLTFC